MVTFAKVLNEWATLLPGVSKLPGLKAHKEAGPWGALTGCFETRVPTRAALGLGPGQRGCQGPILGAVRTHYPHPVPRNNGLTCNSLPPQVGEEPSPPARGSGFLEGRRWRDG